MDPLGSSPAGVQGAIVAHTDIWYDAEVRYSSMLPARRSVREGAFWDRVLRARSNLSAARTRSETLIGLTRDVGSAVANCENTVANYQAELRELRAEVAHLNELTDANHERILLALRMVRDNDVGARHTLWQLRATPDYQLAFDEDEPLVSVIIATYLEWPLLRDRALPSILEQTYERWEADRRRRRSARRDATSGRIIS